ncbi:BPSS1780 family membrane protein [Mycoavidus sp. B2-EB]|uniref:BPSS1780 family membrane protein n=1 Tax=Mycoavidus sp. B2-EB TaxID=2651972 RepID=UPI0016268AC0|nr:BPSS1780 family membrane protein [Mycoavidus sp. B2-EB]BBO59677.1 hypothetical protein MPB2EB_0801 [Mycoavidus sp. B2-EB]
MYFNQVPAKTGYLWFKQGLQLFWENLTIFLMGSLGYTLLMLLISSAPVLGHYLPLVLLPLVTICFMTVCRNTLNHESTSPIALLASLRTTFSQRVVWQLLLLGLCQAFALFILVFLIQKVALLNAQPKIMESNPLILFVLMLAMILSSIANAMLLWFSPALTAWRQVPLHKAIFFSGVVCWRNLSAIVVHGLLWLGFACALSLIVFSILSAFGSTEEQIKQNLIFIMQIILVPVSFCTRYASYISCFPTEPPPTIQS